MLVQSTAATSQTASKFTRGKRAKRWGSGGLVKLGGAEEYEPIDGPPSYLEVYKKHVAKVSLG